MTDGTEIVPGAGSFYSYSKKEGLRKHQENITISNGIAITADNQTFYYIDSMKHRVEAYDFDMKDGKMSEYDGIWVHTKYHCESYVKGSVQTGSPGQVPK